MRTTDRRFIKTEKIIFNSMVDLLQKSDPESLLIDDLVNEADINKSTFYLHYQSLDQLISAIEDRLIAGISSVLYGVGESGSLEEAFKALIDWILENKKMANAVLRSSTYRFNEKIENLVKQFLKPLKPLKRNKIADDNAFKQGAFVQAEVAILRIWIMDGCHFDRNVILNQCLSVAKDSYFADLLKNC